MIIDTLENFGSYLCLHNNFKTVKEFLDNNDLKSLEVGRYELDGDNVYLSVQEYSSKIKDQAKPEAHKKYIDIQIVISGEELIGYANIKDTKPYSFYDADKDIEFLNGEVEFFNATENKFFILYPQDAHMPSIAVEKPALVKKAVFKVKVN